MKTKDRREFARDCVAGTALTSQQTMYRWTNAGTVVRILIGRGTCRSRTRPSSVRSSLCTASSRTRIRRVRRTRTARRPRPSSRDVYSELLTECGTETDDDGNEVQIAPTFDEVSRGR